jgi:anti-anti-sigma regulatory factor
MLLNALPVVIPYKLPGNTETVFTVQVDTLAACDGDAVGEARALVEAWLNLRHPGVAINLMASRAKLGTAAEQPAGPLLYFLSPLNHIHSLLLPPRIDNEPGERLGETLSGLDASAIFGVVMDCTHLTYINTAGLASLASQVKRLRIHVHSLPDSVRTVLEIVGLLDLLHVHPDRESALRALVADCRQAAAAQRG